MSKKTNVKSPKLLTSLRKGEGSSVVSIDRQDIGSSDGNTYLQMGINLGSASVPERRYAAEVCSVVSESDLIRLIFCQRKVSGGFRSLMEIMMTATSAFRFYELVSGMTQPTVMPNTKYQTALPNDFQKTVSCARSR